MQEQTSTTADARVQVGTLLIDRAHHHRLVSSTPRSEERAARDRVRAIRRARAAKAKADAGRRAAVIREELARPRAKDCHCPITPDSTLRDLLVLGAGCTAGRWVCPTLDAIRRRLGR
jgi:hypothetical protein